MLDDGAGATPQDCASGNGAHYRMPSPLFVGGMVRYSKDGAWHARRGAVVDIEKRASSRACLPATSTYETVGSRVVTADVFCGSD